MCDLFRLDLLLERERVVCACVCNCSASKTETTCKNCYCFLSFISVALQYLKGEVCEVATYVWCFYIVVASVRTIEKENSCQDCQSWKQNTLINKNVCKDFSESKSPRQILQKVFQASNWLDFLGLVTKPKYFRVLCFHVRM